MIWKAKAKPKKREPETEFVAPLSLEECMTRLWRLEEERTYERWNGAETRVSAEVVDKQDWLFTVTRAFERAPRLPMLQRKHPLVQVSGKMSRLSENQTTMVLMESEVRSRIPFSILFYLFLIAFWEAAPCAVVLALILQATGFITMVLVALAVGGILYLHVRYFRSMAQSDTRRFELISDIRRVLVIPANLPAHTPAEPIQAVPESLHKPR